MAADAKISQLQLATQWLQYVIENEQELLEKFTRSRRNILYNSFKAAVQSQSADKVIAVTLRFNQYLRFLDMGVGRGVPIGSRKAKNDFLKFRNTRGQLHKYKRKKIPVYNKPMSHQVKRLTELLSEHFNIKAISMMDNTLTKKGSVDINL